MKYFLVMLVLIIPLSNLFSQGEVIITETNKDNPFKLSGNLFYLIDTTNDLTHGQVMSSGFDNKFTQAGKSKFYYKGGHFSQWYKLSIRNLTSETQELVLSIDNPLIGDITFFSTLDTDFTFNTGIQHPWNERLYSFKNFLFPIQLLPNESSTYVFKIAQQEFPSYVPISLNSKDYIQVKLSNYSFFYGIIISIMLFFAVLMLVLWWYEKSHSFIILILLLFSLIVYNLWREGIFYQYLFSNNPTFNLSFGSFLIPLEILLLTLFVRFHFKIGKSSEKIKNVFTIAIIFGIGFTFLQLMIHDYTFFLVGTQLMLLVFIAFSIISFVISSNTKNSYQNQFVILVSVLYIDLICRIFLPFGIKGFGLLDIQLSALFMVGFFIITLSIFITRFNKAKVEVLDMKINLEHLVEKRTSQLNSQKEELKTQHEELLQQKETLQSQREELRAQKELLEIKNVELAKLSLVASKTDNLIYIFNSDGELDWFNASFSLVLGLTTEEYKRGKPLNIVDISTNKNIRHVLNTCIREKNVVSYESTIVDTNKNTKWFHTTLTPILDDLDQITNLIAIDTDITRLKQFEDELEQKSKDADHQKNLAVIRKEELEERQIEIYDSIRYAKRIQTAIMPKVKQIQRDFQDSFVLFLPKDIVSGDFYWYHRIGNKYFMAAVDCTGHGVPGAFMSIIGNYLLNSIVIHNLIFDPAEILKQLNRKIKIALKSDNRTQTSDGMDIALVVIDKNEKTLEFASALRPMFLFSNDNFTEVKGDKTPITSSISGTSITTFTNQKFDFNEGDMFYIFSDGIIDQFGGDSGKKYLTKRFKQLLFEISPMPMKEQKEIIKHAFDEWRGDYEQVDDILVMGIRYMEETRY